MTVLLDLVYILLALVGSPFILVKMARSERWRAGWKERLGFVPGRAGQRCCVWVHAVSVGEANAARTFIELLEREYPDLDVRVSTTTNTGQSVARRLFGAERCFYFPLDLSSAVRRAFRRIRPDAVVLMELEVWPNFLRIARKRGVPVVIINGRMREQRVKSYRRMRFLFSPLYDAATDNLFCVQNETYADRFERAGLPAERIRVTGNMKYDAVRAEVAAEQRDAVRRALGLRPEERLWVAACTWAGEEAICLRVHRRLLEEDPALRLVIAPRHIERADAVERTIAEAGFTCRRRTKEDGPTGADTACLLDTIGELVYLYSLAAFAFVGKSLAVGGGHNVLEPAALGAVPVFGPMTENFENEARLLLDAGAAERVADENELAQTGLRLLRDPAGRLERARKGREILLEHSGASQRNVEIVKTLVRQCRMTYESKGRRVEESKSQK